MQSVGFDIRSWVMSKSARVSLAETTTFDNVLENNGMDKGRGAKIMRVCIECGGASRVQYDVGARCGTLSGDLKNKTWTN